MKSRNIFLIVVIFLAGGIFFASCKKEESQLPKDEALFTYVSHGYTIAFTNTSAVKGSVLWDFGDSTTSTIENPTHTYAVKGTYLVTLTVTSEQGKTYSVFTRLNVNKATRIHLDDGTFSDWDAVTEKKFIVHFNDTILNVVTAAKFDFDANMVYVYIKYRGVDSVWFDVEMDNDNDSLTGNTSWTWTGIGADYLIEGQFAAPGVSESDFTPYYYNGTDWPNDQWAWGDDKPFPPGYITIGTVKVQGGYTTIEFGISRSKVPGLNNDLVTWGIMLSDPVSWDEIGDIPGPGKAFTIDMK